MTWGSVAEVVGTHRCIEQVRYGRCACRNRKGENPCQEANDLMNNVINHDGGDTETLLKFLRRKTCGLSRQGRMCNHRGCIAKEQAIDFVCAAQKKAA